MFGNIFIKQSKVHVYKKKKSKFDLLGMQRSRKVVIDIAKEKLTPSNAFHLLTSPN